MATVEEIIAKAAEWGAAGNPANAAKLRAHAETLKAPAASKYSVADIEAKAAEWDAAGNPENAAKLRAKAASMKPAVQPGERQSRGPSVPDRQTAVENAMRPPRADAPRDEFAEFAAFEAANPPLAGKFSPGNFPAVGVVIGGGKGFKGGGDPGYTVKAQADTGTFGDTAKAMVAGPMAAAGAFSAGLTGSGDSPSREFLANDPLTRGLPGPILTGLGKVGDAGGAALSVVGAGISGAAGLGAELMPGQDAAGELALAEDLTGMAMFAVPELAGVSSVPARMAAGASKVAPVARVVPKVAAAAKVVPKVADDVAVAATMAETGSLARRAAMGGRGSAAAQKSLAKSAKVNPEAKAAADRLGMDLPADVFSDSENVRKLVGLTRSEVGKEAESLWLRSVKGARDKADEVIAAIDGSPDIASISEAVKGGLQMTQSRLKATAKTLYEAVDARVPKSTSAEVSNIVKALNGVIEDLGGPKGMSTAEKALYDLVTGDQPVTYGRLLREKALIGKAIARGESPYSSMDGATLARIYGAISDDQLATVASIGDDGLRAQLREANQMTAKQKGLEKRIIAAFGSDLDGSIGSKLRGAIVQGSKGDIAGLARVLKVIPEDLRKSATASAIAAATRSARATEPGFGLSEFSKVFGGIIANKPVFDLIQKNLGDDATKMLKDLHIVAQRIAVADSNVLRTGKANQALATALTADGLVGRVLNSTGGQRVAQASAIGVGGVVGGAPGAMLAGPLVTALTKGAPDMLAKAGRMLTSPEFQKLATEAAAGAASDASIAALKTSPAFRAWSMRLPPTVLMDFLKGLGSKTTPVAAAQSANTDMPPAKRITAKAAP